MLFLKSISKRGGGQKWEVDEHKQWSEKVRIQHFSPPLLDKNRNYAGMRSNKRKLFVKPVGMNGSNFKNETLFVSFTAIIINGSLFLSVILFCAGNSL